MFEKITSVIFVGSDPRLLEIGAKWRTHWAIILKNSKKQFSLFKKFNQDIEKSWSY